MRILRTLRNVLVSAALSLLGLTAITFAIGRFLQDFIVGPTQDVVLYGYAKK